MTVTFKLSDDSVKATPKPKIRPVDAVRDPKLSKPEYAHAVTTEHHSNGRVIIAVGITVALIVWLTWWSAWRWAWPIEVTYHVGGPWPILAGFIAAVIATSAKPKWIAMIIAVAIIIATAIALIVPSTLGNVWLPVLFCIAGLVLGRLFAGAFINTGH